jgi:hypothetical protein
MGMLGPLTAQALGRSPYDEVVDGDGEADSQEPAQQYDSRGRPVNPETRRTNRDIIRAHNEVMLVIGVAEPENQQPSTELASQIRHEAYEEQIGEKLMPLGARAIEFVGLLGLDSLRQRILVYKHYAQCPFWKSFYFVRRSMSISRDILAGLPAGFVVSQTESVLKPWLIRREKDAIRRV